MFGISEFLHSKRIEMLEKVRVEAELKERRLREIEALEKDIDKHNVVKKKRMDKRIARIRKIKEIICGKADKIPVEALLTDQTKLDIEKLNSQYESEQKMKRFDKAMGVNNGISKKDI